MVFVSIQCSDLPVNSPKGRAARTNIRIFAIPKLRRNPSYINLLAYRGHGENLESAGRHCELISSSMFSSTQSFSRQELSCTQDLLADPRKETQKRRESLYRQKFSIAGTSVGDREIRRRWRKFSATGTSSILHEEN